MKKRHFLAAAAAVAGITALTSVFSVAEKLNTKPIDLVILLDDTASMKESDSNHLASTAIKKIADKLQNVDVNYGLIKYDIYAEEGGSLPLGKHSVQELYAFADSITQEGKGTDAAVALDWGVKQLESAGRPGAVHSIIVIGDGENSYYRNGVQVRTNEESEAIKANALSRASNGGMDVYSLAINKELNPNAMTQEQYNAEMSNINNLRAYFSTIPTGEKGFATETSTSTIDADVQKIVNTINAMQSNHIDDKLKPNENKEHPITIDEGVIMLNIAVDHDDQLESTIKAPSGKAYNVTADNVTVSKQADYTNYNIVNPEKGTWTVAVKNISDKDENIKIDITTLSDMTVDIGEVTEDDGIHVTSKLYDKDRALVTDGNSLVNLKASVRLIDDKDNAAEFPLTVNGDGTFTTTINYDDISNNGTYKLQTVVKNGDKEISSAEIPVKIEKPVKWMKWVILIAIVLGVILLAAAVIALKIMLDNKRIGVPGKVKVKLTGRNNQTKDYADFIEYQTTGESVFQAIGSGTLSELMSAYASWYGNMYNSETDRSNMAEFFDQNLMTYIRNIGVKAIKKKGGTIIVTCSAKAGGADHVKYYVDEEEVVNSITRTIPKNADEDIEIVIKDEQTGKDYRIMLNFNTMPEETSF